MAETGTSVARRIEDVAGRRSPASVSPAGRPDAARLLLLLALVLTVLSYVNTLRFQFVYDDLPQIVSNPRVHSWQHAPRLFVEHVWSQFSGQPGNYYRPLFELWLVINYSLFGANPAWWHASTVAVHLLVVCMVYLLARRVTGDRLTAAIATVIYGLHPTHIETVAWVSGVTEPLLAVFVIGSCLSYARSCDDGEVGAPWWRAASVAMYGLAMLCKETGVVVPLLLFAYDRLILARPAQPRQTLSSLAKRYAPYAIVAVAYMAQRHYVLRGLGFPEVKPWLDVVLTLPSFLWFYVHALLWPVGLSVFHDTPLVHTPGLANFALPLVGVAAAVGALVWASRRSRAAAFGSLWLAVLMVPPIAGIYAFVAEDLVHDRYLYLPSVGFAFVLAWAIRSIKSEQELFGAPRVQMAVTLVLGCALAAGTAMQNVYWTNDLILYAHAVQAAPRNVIAINHLANEFYKRRRYDDALRLYAESLSVKQDHWATHFALGITYYELGKFPEAQQHLEIAIPLLPNNADEYYYLGLVQMQQAQYAQAEPNLRKALAMFGAKSGFHYALATSLEKQGKLAQARAELQEELKINPDPQVKRELERIEKLATSD